MPMRGIAAVPLPGTWPRSHARPHARHPRGLMQFVAGSWIRLPGEVSRRGTRLSRHTVSSRASDDEASLVP